MEMLQSVAPHCLKTSQVGVQKATTMAGQESRHAFQNSMVDALGSALQSIHTKQEATVAEAQKGLEDLVARQAGGSRAVWMAARSSTASS